MLPPRTLSSRGVASIAPNVFDGMSSRDTCTNHLERNHVRDHRTRLIGGPITERWCCLLRQRTPPRSAGRVSPLAPPPQLMGSSTDGAIRGRAHPTVSRLRPGTKHEPERERRERGGNISLAAVATRSGPSQQSGGHPRPEGASGATAPGRACPPPRRSPSSASNRPLAGRGARCNRTAPPTHEY